MKAKGIQIHSSNHSNLRYKHRKALTSTVCLNLTRSLLALTCSEAAVCFPECYHLSSRKDRDDL